MMTERQKHLYAAREDLAGACRHLRLVASTFALEAPTRLHVEFATKMLVTVDKTLSGLLSASEARRGPP